MRGTPLTPRSRMTLLNADFAKSLLCTPPSLSVGFLVAALVVGVAVAVNALPFPSFISSSPSIDNLSKPTSKKMTRMGRDKLVENNSNAASEVKSTLRHKDSGIGSIVSSSSSELTKPYTYLPEPCNTHAAQHQTPSNFDASESAAGGRDHDDEAGEDHILCPGAPVLPSRENMNNGNVLLEELHAHDAPTSPPMSNEDISNSSTNIRSSFLDLLFSTDYPSSVKLPNIINSGSRSPPTESSIGTATTSSAFPAPYKRQRRFATFPEFWQPPLPASSTDSVTNNINDLMFQDIPTLNNNEMDHYSNFEDLNVTSTTTPLPTSLDHPDHLRTNTANHRLTSPRVYFHPHALFPQLSPSRHGRNDRDLYADFDLSVMEQRLNEEIEQRQLQKKRF